MITETDATEQPPHREVLLQLLESAWRAGGAGTVDGARGYVQWAKFPEGLQIECVSNRFLPADSALDFRERRQLQILGFQAPNADQQDYHRRFLTQDTLPEAAEVLRSVLGLVLQERGNRPAPEVVHASQGQRGHVMAVLPAGKADRLVVQDVVDRVFYALRDRTEVVLIDAYGVRDGTGDSLDEYLAAGTARPKLAAGAVLMARREAHDSKEWRLLAERVAEAALRLRDGGHHVLIVGPPFLPGNESLWIEGLGWCADGVCVVGPGYGPAVADPVARAR